jgi:hypothetical protein
VLHLRCQGAVSMMRASIPVAPPPNTRTSAQHGRSARESAQLALQRPAQRNEPRAYRQKHLLTPASQEYADVNRTYHDVAETLSNYPSLSPRTEVYSMRPARAAAHARPY